MDDSYVSRFFLEPTQTFQRRDEALRALCVDGLPRDHVAGRFGYQAASLRARAGRFRGDCRRGVTPPFFSPTAGDDLSGHPRAQTDRGPNGPQSPIVAN
jgi:hypothetical protein